MRIACLHFAFGLDLAGTSPLLAQRLEVEKTHDVSGKAKRGYLPDVTQTYVMMAPVALNADKDADKDADDSQFGAAADAAVMLAHLKGAGKLGAGKLKDAHQAIDYEYLRVSARGEVKDKLPVKSPNSGWQVAGFVPLTGGGVLAHGPAIDNQKKYRADMPAGDDFKGKQVVFFRRKQVGQDPVVRADVAGISRAGILVGR